MCTYLTTYVTIEPSKFQTIFQENLQIMKRHPIKFLLFRILPVLIVFIYSILLLFVVINGNPASPVYNADAILVLGHGVDDQTSPTPWLRERLLVALALYEQGYADYIIVSGGIGPSDTIPVAYIMSDFLANHGVPIESIIIEDNANNTYQNFLFTQEISQEKNYQFEQIIVVTNDFHIFRSMLLSTFFFSSEDLSWVNAPVPFDASLLLAYLREPISIIYNFTIWRILTWT